MMHDAAGTDGWSMALMAVYGLGLWALTVAAIVVLAAQVGRARSRDRGPHHAARRPWI